MKPHNRRFPSSLYVFVVLSLATFMLLFGLARSPGIWYIAEAQVQALHDEAMTGMEIDTLQRQARQLSINVDHIIASMRAAELLAEDKVEPTRAALSAAVDRWRLQTSRNQEGAIIDISLESLDPLRDQRLVGMLAMAIADDPSMSELAGKSIKLEALPVELRTSRGGTVLPRTLVVICMLASVVGFAGVWWAERSQPPRQVFHADEIRELAGVPVLTTIRTGAKPIAVDATRWKRRVFHLGVWSAELGIAVAFMLVLSQIITQAAYFSRFLEDPLAAYGEAIARVLG